MASGWLSSTTGTIKRLMSGPAEQDSRFGRLQPHPSYNPSGTRQIPGAFPNEREAMDSRGRTAPLFLPASNINAQGDRQVQLGAPQGQQAQSLNSPYNRNSYGPHSATGGNNVAAQTFTSSRRRDDGVEDVYIAVMGVTGAGKSSFIETCTGKTAGVGNSLRSQTQQVGEYEFMYSPNLRVHLIDTPGFDDTDRKDSEVLRDIAGWLGVTYKQNIRLSGIIYLHRIIDPRLGGSAKRNLFMFQKLCGEKCLDHIVLATTMWGIVPPDMGAQREKELIEVDEFWGYMCRHGSQVLRHLGDRRSAFAILEAILGRRKKVTLKIQKEMSSGMDLDETQAGQQLNADILKERERHKRDMSDLEMQMRAALDQKDQEMAQHIAQLQAETQAKINAGEESQKKLRVDLERLQSEREAEMTKLQKDLKEQMDLLNEQRRQYEELQRSSSFSHSEMQVHLNDLRAQLEQTTEKLQNTSQNISKTKSGVLLELGEWLQQAVDEAIDSVQAWWRNL